MADATALVDEATRLCRLIGPPPEDDATAWDEDLEHWEDRHEMAADVLALVARFDPQALWIAVLAVLSLQDDHLGEMGLLARAALKVEEGGQCEMI